MELAETEEKTVIVTDQGFAADDWTGGFVALGELPEGEVERAVDLGPGDRPEELQGRLDRIEMIRVTAPVFSDGRIFTIARALRRLGYRGRLRAAGHVIADQYPMARSSGFDEVEIPAGTAARQPEIQWRPAGAVSGSYQARLGFGARVALQG